MWIKLDVNVSGYVYNPAEPLLTPFGCGHLAARHLPLALELDAHPTQKNAKVRRVQGSGA
jgi:hypothetical protein